MTEPIEIFLGFDPGGEGKFGWSICREDGCKLRVLKTDAANNAKEVMAAVEQALADCQLPTESVLGIGIDAPMFWSETGNRKIDDTIRKEVNKAPQTHREKKPRVLAVNSLWGGVLVQGVLLRDALCQRFNTPITEAHPLALECLEPFMPSYIICPPTDDREHQRDATYAAYAAWRMHQHTSNRLNLGWRNLFCDEPGQNLIPPLPTPVRVDYWMPIP